MSTDAHRATEVKQTTGWMVQGSTKLSYDGVEASISSQFTSELGMTSSQSEQLINERTEEMNLTTGSKDKRFIRWVLVDRFIIREGGDQFSDILKEWQVVSSKVRDFSIER
jgi:hypothetical protein